MSNDIEEIKNRLNIVEVIGSYIKLKKAGANYKALCPFHSEKTPSFVISPARQIWHCFGSCGFGGDVFKFVMQIEGVEFKEALRMMAKKAGVELKRVSPKLITERQKLLDICELSTRFFERQIQASKIGQQAKEYLLSRGINQDSIVKWRIGYAPDTWQGLTDFLVSQEFDRDQAVKAGLAIKSEKGSFYDRFRGRIVFPIFDLNSQVVGFTGRVFKGDEKQAKYVNTPSTALYDKSRILYGLDKAKLAIRKKGSCILVEGQTDAIMASQARHENVVATSGTALTPYQLAILKRYSENILTAFDMDLAGDSATKRGIDLAQTQGFNIKVIIMPKGKDPADLISQNKAQWEKIAGEAKSVLDFYFQTAFERFDPATAEGKKEIAKSLLPVIKRIPDRIEQSHWIQILAQKLKVKEDDIREELAKAKISQEFVQAPAPPAIKETGKKPRQELLEERLLALIVESPANIKIIKLADLSFFSDKTSQIIKHFQEKLQEKQKLTYGLPQEFVDFINYLGLKSEVHANSKDTDIECQECLKQIRSLGIKKALNQISEKIRTAEQKSDFSKANELLEKFNKVSKQIRD